MAKTAILELADVSLSFKQRSLLNKSQPHKVLKSISFHLGVGETLGIVGRNGCGKSTLLRLVAGIYRQDEGQILRNCRRISLLSLALGFDRELNGWDNALLSGMLLGHSKEVVLSRMPEIIDYSELGNFIRQPVKTYSSGMRARLGFSVAVTLETELLLVDEVLGVGDASFRQKAEATMVEKMGEGQSTIFVSHAAKQVERLCDRVVWLEQGKVVSVGEAEAVVAEYQKFLSTQEKRLL